MKILTVILLLSKLLLWDSSSVDAALNVYTSPMEVLKPAKSSVIVDCISTPKDNVRIIWQHYKKQIPFFPATGIASEDTYMFGNHSLYIRSLRKRNTGKYTCIASSGAERMLSSTVVRVAYLQQFVPIVPVKAFEGSVEASINCAAPRGVPKPSVFWKKDGKVINNTRITSVPSFTNDIEGSKLIIKNVKLSDAGKYTCIAKNMVKERNVTTSFEVVTPGDVVVKPKDEDVIKENESSFFQCLSKSVPPLPVEWKKLEENCEVKPCKYIEKSVTQSDRIKIIDGKLSISNAQPKDKGRYKCVAGLNSEFVSKNVTLNVVELIKIDVNQHQEIQRKDLRKNKDVRISCRFRGDGKYGVSWVRSDTKKLPVNMKEEKKMLQISNLKLADAGEYLCTATGLFNTVVGKVKLEVYESPEFLVKPGNVTGTVGDSAWVHCSGKGIPMPSVNYLKSKNNHQKTDAILNETRFITLKNHTLHITELKKEDNGAYFCWLTQRHASIYSDFYLTVRDPIRNTDSGTPMARTVGIAVGCAGVYILLVIGLMIYCRARRARLLKKGLITEADDGECLKDPLVGNEDIPMQNGICLDQWLFPREDLKEQVTLGRGKMGRIFRAKAIGVKEDASEKVVVVKEFDGEIEEYKNDFHLEVEMFSQLNHDYVVHLIGVTTDSHPYYIISDYSELGDLKQHLTSGFDISSSARLHMAFCIASGMEYLIKLHYIHRDLAARNCIPYVTNNVKVSFLSICEDLYHDDYYLLNSIPVPLRWLSPEAIRSEAYSEKSDVWSFGVTMWEIFSGGKTPYSDCKNDKVLDGVCKELRLPMPRGCPQNVFGIMKQCWIADSNQRPSFEELTSLISEIIKV